MPTCLALSYLPCRGPAYWKGPAVMWTLSRCRLLAALSTLVVSWPVLAAPPALHERIDQAIVANQPSITIAATASDAEFLRRVFLDLTGLIPTATEARAFFKDQAPDKRTRLVEH